MAEQQPGLSRRAFVQGAAAAVSSLNLLGCHHNYVMDTGRLVPPPGFDPSVTPLTVDVHCHIFNGTDLQVAEFLRETHALPGWAAALLQTINWRFATSGEDELKVLRQLVGPPHAAKASPSAPIGELDSDLRKKIEQQVEQGHLVAQSKLREAVDAEPAQSPKLQWLQHRAGLIDVPVISTPPSHGPSPESDQRAPAPQAATPQAAAARRALELFQQQTALAATGREQLRRELPLATMTETVMVSAGPQATAPSKPPSAKFDKKSGVVHFFLQYFSPRYVSAQDYLDTFCRKAKRNVDLMFASLVDYDWWIAGGMSPLTTMQTQIEIMEQIAVLSGGRVHAFAPFCPLREVAHRAGQKGFGSTEVTWSPLALVRDAVMNRGFIGVKMYPPMGFAPFGNAELEKKPPAGAPSPSCPGEVSAHPGPAFWSNDDLLPDWCIAPIDYGDGKPPATLGQRLDEALADLYRWCSDNGVPVLAHTHTSNGPSDDFMALAEATYWEKALKVYPNLSVNFGHLGGFDEGNGLTTVPCSSDQYLRLAAPSPQLYASTFGDAAYEETVLRNATAAGERIGTAYKKYPVFADRFLYGSDWSLLIAQGKNDVYLKNFISQMNHLDAPRKPGDPLSISQRFFGWNSVTYAGLAQNDATRKRLDAFYLKNNVSKPLWAQKVDQRAKT